MGLKMNLKKVMAILIKVGEVLQKYKSDVKKDYKRYNVKVLHLP